MNADELAEAVVGRAAELIPIELRLDFSEEAFHEFQRSVGSYVKDLAEHAFAETEAAGADRVTTEYVRSASRHLRSRRRSVLVTILSTIGGIVFGAALSALPSWVGGHPVTAGEALLVGLGFAVGTGLLVWSWVLEYVGR